MIDALGQMRQFSSLKRINHYSLINFHVSSETFFPSFASRESDAEFRTDAGIIASLNAPFQEGHSMRTGIFLVCAALCIAAGAATGADDSYDKLYSAIRANDPLQMKALLDEGVRANAEGPDGITPLMVAAEIGSLDAMKMLIDQKRLHLKGVVG